MSVTLTTEQKLELDRFPEVLKTLVAAELAAGNKIVEIGHSFPAPPVGAYIKLANKVSTRARETAEGLDFYERNSSSYSGQFTDEKGYFFVLEPPNPPPEEIDMDLLRESYQPKPSATNQGKPEEPTSSRSVNDSIALEPATLTNLHQTHVAIEETATSSKRVMHFRDQRMPQEIQFALERTIRSLFKPIADREKLCWHAQSFLSGAKYDLELVFEAALPETNCYSISMHACWSDQSASNSDYFRQNSKSWFEMWTRELHPANPPDANEGVEELYEQRADNALNAEVDLDSVIGVQQAIIAAMKHGATFGTSHKEGGTNIYWRVDRFISSDYGDYPDHKNYTSETEFLYMLWQFFKWELATNAGKEERSELDTWRLIFRRLNA